MKFTYTYKSLRGQVSREIEIDETEQAKTFPEVIKVDGEVYTQQNQLDRYGYTWQATAGGIRVFFRSDGGKDFSIMRERLRKKNLWKDEVAELIKSTGKTMTEVAELTEVPYRTLQHWKGGDREPSNMVKKAFRTAVHNIGSDTESQF